VETPQQLDFLRGQICDEVQGFLYSPALPEADCSALLRSGGHSPVENSITLCG
jgi:EAL domain-containing protein (putative c-di-GMP-specific phosphodiesterase class I)